jgi:hypothetical protein
VSVLRRRQRIRHLLRARILITRLTFLVPDNWTQTFPDPTVDSQQGGCTDHQCQVNGNSASNGVPSGEAKFSVGNGSNTTAGTPLTLTSSLTAVAAGSFFMDFSLSNALVSGWSFRPVVQEGGMSLALTPVDPMTHLPTGSFAPLTTTGNFAYEFTVSSAGNLAFIFQFRGTGGSGVNIGAFGVEAAPGPIPGTGLLSFGALSVLGLGSFGRKWLQRRRA